MVPSRSPLPIATMSRGTIRKKRSCNTSSMTRSQTYPRASGSLVGFNNGKQQDRDAHHRHTGDDSEEPADDQGVGVGGYPGQVVRALQNPGDELIGDDERNRLGQEQHTNDDCGFPGRSHGRPPWSYFAVLTACLAGVCHTVMATLPEACPFPT